MAGVNKAILVGRLGKDPEIRYTPTGTAICNFSIATSEKRKNEKGEVTEKTEWHSIVALGKTAEICTEYLSKGSLVYIEGKLQTRNWEKDGVTHYKTEVLAQSVQFLESKKKEAPPSDIDDVPF